MMIFNPTTVEAQAPCGDIEKQGETQAGAEEFAALLAFCFAPIAATVHASSARIVPAPESDDSAVDEIESAPPPSMTFEPNPTPEETQVEGVEADGSELKSFTPLVKPRGAPADFPNESVNGFNPQAARNEGREPTTPTPALNWSLAAQPLTTTEHASAVEKAARVIEWKPPIAVNGEARADEKGEVRSEVVDGTGEGAVGEILTEALEAPSTPRTAAARRDTISFTSLLAEATRGANTVRGASSVKQLLGENFNRAARIRTDGVDETTATSALVEGATKIAQASNPPLRASTNEIIAQTVSPLVALAESLQRRESRTIRLRLRPEELGEVELQVTREAGGRLSVQLSAERDAARDTLTNGLTQLRDSLERAGVAIERLEVSAGFRLGQGASEQRHESSERQAAPDSNATFPIHETRHEDGAHAAPDDRLLNLRA